MPDGGLNPRIHFPVVDTDAALVVQRRRGAGLKVVAEQADHLFDGAFVGTFVLHDFVKEADVQGHHGNSRRRLGHERLVHADQRAAAHPRSQFGVQDAGGLFQMLLGPSDRAGSVDRVRQLRTDVAIGDRAAALGQESLGQQGPHPKRPILAAHDLDRRVNVVVGCGGNLHGHDLIVAEVYALAGVGGADRFQDRRAALSGRGINPAGAGQAIDDAVQLGPAVFESLDRLGLDLVRVGVAIHAVYDPALFLGAPMNRRHVVPTRRRRLVPLGGSLQTDVHGARAVPEHRRDQAGKAVAGAAADHQDIPDSAGCPGRARDLDLTVDIRRAARWMRVQTKKASNPRRDDLRSCHASYCQARPRRSSGPVARRQ